MKSRPTTTFLQLLLLSLLKRVKVGLFTNRPTIYTLCPPNFSVLGGGGQNTYIGCPPPFVRGALPPPPPSFPGPRLGRGNGSNLITLHRPICRSVDKGLANPALGAPLAKRTLQRRQQISTPLKKEQG